MASPMPTTPVVVMTNVNRSDQTEYWVEKIVTLSETNHNFQSVHRDIHFAVYRLFKEIYQCRICQNKAYRNLHVYKQYLSRNGEWELDDDSFMCGKLNKNNKHIRLIPQEVDILFQRFKIAKPHYKLRITTDTAKKYFNELRLSYLRHRKETQLRGELCWSRFIARDTYRDYMNQNKNNSKDDNDDDLLDEQAKEGDGDHGKDGEAKTTERVILDKDNGDVAAMPNNGKNQNVETTATEEPKNAFCATNATNKSTEAYMKFTTFLNRHKEKWPKLELKLVMEYFEDGDNLDNWIHFFPKYYCDFIGYCKINEDGYEDDEQFTLLKMYRKFFLLGNTTDEWIDHNDLEKMTSCYDSDADNNDTPTKSAMRSKMSSTEQCGINLLLDASNQKQTEDNGKGSVTGDENEELKKSEAYKEWEEDVIYQVSFSYGFFI